MEKKKKGKRILLTVLCVVLAVVLIALIGTTIYVENLLGRINRTDEMVQETLTKEEIQQILEETDPPAEEEYTGEVLEPEEVVLATDPVELIETDEDIINILLIGQDRREGQGRQRSDAMILCTINLEEKTLVMTSFLRDLYVKIPEWNGEKYADNRLNSNYAIGGMEMLNECLKMNFGVVVDHNIEVDFSGFEDIVNVMGGVSINLTSAEARRVGGGAKAGLNWLNGEQALAYARIRKIDSDFARTNRQRTVLLAMLEKVRDMSLSELNDLITGFMPLITTDMSNSDIIQYVAKVFPILSELEVTTQHIPANHTYKGAMIRGMSVVVPDLEANIQILRDTIG